MGRPAKVRRTQGVLGGRSVFVVRRVLDAALHELAHSGYAEFRVEAVAAKAGVNKTTIYRRWPTKGALITQVVAQLSAPLWEQRLPDTGDLQEDLLLAFTQRHTFARKVQGRAWARLLEERSRPEVEGIISEVVTGRRDEWRGMIDRAIRRGELPSGTDPRLVLELIRAIVDDPRTARVLGQHRLPTAVRTIVAGARAGALVGRGAAPPGRRRRAT